MTCRRAFSFSKKPNHEKRRAKGFRPPFFGTQRGGEWDGHIFQKAKWLSQKSAGGAKPFRGPKEHLFCSLQFTRFSTERPCGASSAAGPYCTSPPKYGTALSDGVANTHMGENSRAIRPAYHRERRRRRTEDETLPRTVSRPQRYMRYITNDLHRRPFFPPQMGCPAHAPHPPLFRQTRQLSGCFRPPMRRLRAVMDAIAHTRDNSRPSDGCRAYRHSGRLAHCGRCQIHASSTDRSLSGIFQHCGKSRCPPLFYAQ